MSGFVRGLSVIVTSASVEFNQKCFHTGQTVVFLGLDSASFLSSKLDCRLAGGFSWFSELVLCSSILQWLHRFFLFLGTWDSVLTNAATLADEPVFIFLVMTWMEFLLSGGVTFIVRRRGIVRFTCCWRAFRTKFAESMRIWGSRYDDIGSQGCCLLWMMTFLADNTVNDRRQKIVLTWYIVG